MCSGVLPRRPALASAQLTGFFGALDGALRCRAAVLRAARGLGRLAGNEAVLSAADALLLLHKWSLVARDSELQGALRAAAEELRARDLLSACGRPARPHPPPLPAPQQPCPPLGSGGGVETRVPWSPRGDTGRWAPPGSPCYSHSAPISPGQALAVPGQCGL